MSAADTAGRGRILERIRAGLRTPAAEPREKESAGDIFPPIEDCLRRFQAECAANTTECVLTGNPAAVLEQVLASLPPGEVFAHDASRLRDMLPRSAGGRAVRWSSQGAPAEASQATVTLAHALVASTGSILVSSACGGRGATIVAPCHVVVASAAQIVPDLDTALALAYREPWGAQASFVGLITGCSRTADIEKLLVIGAHGPKRLVVILEQEPGNI